MLYGVFSHIYDDFEVDGYTEDLDEANKYCAVNSGCEIRPLERLKSDIDYNKYEFVYWYSIIFKGSANGEYKRDDIPDYTPECNYCKCHVKNINLYNKIDYFPKWGNDEAIVSFKIFIKEKNLELAYSTADIYMKDLLSRGNGKITLENVRAMNNEFSEEYRIEQERIKAEIERKNKTRALEGKIRKLKNDIKNKEDDLQKLKEEYEKEIGNK